LAPLPGVVDVRGRGLMLGIELDTAARAARAVEDALASGWILIQEGPDGRVLSLTPPLNVAESLLERATARLAELLSA
jgi:4-aminobutyrate aminotransferase/(S)-3-amino-2-methylpropionate transaminase